VLEGVVGDQARVFTKVRMADVLQPYQERGRSWWRAFNRISAKHFDFVICRANDLQVLCVVELDDSSHASAKRQARDRFVDEICLGIPRFRILSINVRVAMERWFADVPGKGSMQANTFLPAPISRSAVI